MHQCLRFHLAYISERCRAEETKLQAIEMRDIRLRPKLAKVCSQEKATFCKVCEHGHDACLEGQFMPRQEGRHAYWFVGGRIRWLKLARKEPIAEQAHHSHFCVYVQLACCDMCTMICVAVRGVCSHLQ